MKHGTLSAYVRHRCRCDECRQLWSDYSRARAPRYKETRAKNKQKRIERREAGLMPQEAHGTKSGYWIWLCRCEACREFYNAYVRDYRKRQQEAIR